MEEIRNVTCHDVMNHICDNLGEDLNSERCRSIKTHLDSCTCCQNYFDSVETTIKYYRAFNAELPHVAHKRLLTFLDLPDCDCAPE